MLSSECGNRLCGMTRHPKKWASIRGSLAGFEHFPAFVKKRCIFLVLCSWKFPPTWDYENDRVSKTQMFCFFSMEWSSAWNDCVLEVWCPLGQRTTSTDLPESIAHVVNGTDCFVRYLNLRSVKFFSFWFSATATLESYQWPSTVQQPGGLWLFPQVEGTGYWQKYFEAMKPPWRGARVASLWVVWGWKFWMIQCLLVKGELAGFELKNGLKGCRHFWWSNLMFY